MNCRTDSCVVRVELESRAMVKELLESLAHTCDSAVTVLRGCITPEGARLEIELHAPGERLQIAVASLCRPGVSLRTYNLHRSQVHSLTSTLFPAAGGLTRPSAASTGALLAAGVR